MLISSTKNTLTEISRLMFDQISGPHMAQPSQHIKLTITGAYLHLCLCSCFLQSIMVGRLGEDLHLLRKFLLRKFSNIQGSRERTV